jgi:16S rRNA processing protein RimM
MNFFVFGEIVKTRGLRGCVKALSYLESQTIVDGLDFVYLESKSGLKSRYEIKKIDPSGKFLFLELDGISNIEKASELVGSKLLLPRELMGALLEDEYYWQDIIGLDVYSEDGCRLGRIESIFPTGSNDVYVCRGVEKEILIPAIADVIVRISLEEHKMIIRLSEGLLP